MIQTVANKLIDALRTMPLHHAALLFLLENALIFALVLWVGSLLVRRYAGREVGSATGEVSRGELALAVSNVFLNTFVTMAGLMLWRAGVINLRSETGWRVVLDVLLLLLLMDFAMYVLHRVAHTRWLFPLMHSTHHKFERVRPLTLFALNPVENLGFGALWLAVLCAYDATWLGMSIYLMLNVVFGAVGHLGVEPLPRSWKRLKALNCFSTSTFHAQHHQNATHNYGFYTLIWDRLFNTISPRYEDDFGRSPERLQERSY